MRFRPAVAVSADTNAVFETSVGVVHRINERTPFVAHAERGQPHVVDEDVATLVTENIHARVELDTEQFGEVFDDVDKLDIRYSEVNVEWQREQGEQLPKNERFYPEVILANLSGTSIEEELGLDE